MPKNRLEWIIYLSLDGNWKVMGTRNIVQEAYELQIALDQNSSDCVYRSGKVMEDSSAQIIVKDIRLTAMTKYFVRVKVWAGKEESSSAQTCFITGILDVQEWKALFITAENIGGCCKFQKNLCKKRLFYKRESKRGVCLYYSSWFV